MNDHRPDDKDISPEPKVSVIVCTYNQETTIAAALDSVVEQQTDFRFEVLVADDCSTDATPRICELYAKIYPEIVRLVRNRRNKGVTLNYFDALRMARGKYVADLAGDDIWTCPEKLSLQAEIMDADQDVTLCHGAWNKFDATGNVWRPREYAMPAEKTVRPGTELLPSLIAHRKEKWFVHLCSAMYRRDTALEVMEAFPDLFVASRPCEDFQLICLLASRGKVAWMPETLLHYRVGSPSLSSTEKAAKTVRFLCGVALLTRDTADALGFPPQTTAPFCRFNIQYALMQSVIADCSASRRLVKETIRKIRPTRPSLKTRITLTLTSTPLLRRCVVALRRMAGK